MVNYVILDRIITAHAQITSTKIKFEAEITLPLKINYFQYNDSNRLRIMETNWIFFNIVLNDFNSINPFFNV